MNPRTYLFSVIALIVILEGCSGSRRVTPQASGVMLDTPKSLSPGAVRPPPMVRTSIRSASEMNVRSQTAIQSLGFTQIPGAATFVAVSPVDGTLWALSTQPSGTDKYIWYYSNGAWTNISGLASRLSVGTDGTLYAINGAGNIYSYDSGSQIWTGMGGLASDISAAADGGVIVLSNGNALGSDQAIWRYYQGSWQQLPGAGVRIACSLDPNMYTLSTGAIGPRGFYVVNSAHSIYYGAGADYMQLPGQASEIATTTIGGIFAVSPNAGQPYYYDLGTQAWGSQPGQNIASIATDSTRLFVDNADTGDIFESVINAANGTIVEYGLLNNAANPGGIATGPDGNLWFTEYAGKVGKVTTSGTVTEYSVPTASTITDIAAGPDGNLWFTEATANKIGKITTTGVVTEYSTPTSNSHPFGITAGPDGNVWFTEEAGNNIGKVTPLGVITEYAVHDAPAKIVTGPDGDLWFTEIKYTQSQIGKLTTTGTLTEYPVPTTGSQPFFITVGPDNNLWFTEANANNIGKSTTAGVITEYQVPSSSCVAGPPGQQNCGTSGIVTGADGNLWFAESGKIGKMTTSGAATDFSIPKFDTIPDGVTKGPDGKIWFADYGTSAIGRLP